MTRKFSRSEIAKKAWAKKKKRTVEVRNRKDVILDSVKKKPTRFGQKKLYANHDELTDEQLEELELLKWLQRYEDGSLDKALEKAEHGDSTTLDNWRETKHFYERYRH